MDMDFFLLSFLVFLMLFLVLLPLLEFHGHGLSSGGGGVAGIPIPGVPHAVFGAAATPEVFPRGVHAHGLSSGGGSDNVALSPGGVVSPSCSVAVFVGGHGGVSHGFGVEVAGGSGICPGVAETAPVFPNHPAAPAVPTLPAPAVLPGAVLCAILGHANPPEGHHVIQIPYFDLCYIYKRGDYGDWSCGSPEKSPTVSMPYWVLKKRVKNFYFQKRSFWKVVHM